MIMLPFPHQQFWQNCGISFSLICCLFLLAAFPDQSMGFQADLSRDGKIDLKDVILGLKITSGSRAAVNQRADINGNDTIGIEEVLFINQYLAGLRENPAMIDYHSIHTGYATYYAATGEGACGYEASPDNMMVAAINEQQYHNSLPCGSFIKISGPDGEITVRIVDYCPTCETGDIDLSLEAFSQLAEPIRGVIPITWHFVEAEISDTVTYHFHGASHQWWTAVQIRNHLHPVASVEIYDPATNSWTSLNREHYNYFTAPNGMGLGPFTFRLTDYFDQHFIEANVPFSPGISNAGSYQFPALP